MTNALAGVAAPHPAASSTFTIQPLQLPFTTRCPHRTCVQESLRPILLRRMKEDVETLPEKEEASWPVCRRRMPPHLCVSCVLNCWAGIWPAPCKWCVCAVTFVDDYTEFNF